MPVFVNFYHCLCQYLSVFVAICLCWYLSFSVFVIVGICHCQYLSLSVFVFGVICLFRYLSLSVLVFVCICLCFHLYFSVFVSICLANLTIILMDYDVMCNLKNLTGFCGYIPRILWLLLSNMDLRYASASRILQICKISTLTATQELLFYKTRKQTILSHSQKIFIELDQLTKIIYPNL